MLEEHPHSTVIGVVDGFWKDHVSKVIDRQGTNLIQNGIHSIAKVLQKAVKGVALDNCNNVQCVPIKVHQSNKKYQKYIPYFFLPCLHIFSKSIFNNLHYGLHLISSEHSSPQIEGF